MSNGKVYSNLEYYMYEYFSDVLLAIVRALLTVQKFIYYGYKLVIADRKKILRSEEFLE
jgi:hypothetical protein